jgi:hypothetical protein
MILRVLTEELRHGGHLDILRELIDGTTSPANTPVDTTEYLAKVRAAAAPFAPSQSPRSRRRP